MPDQDIASAITQHFAGSRFVEARVLGGQTNAFLLVFENKEEKRGTLSFQPNLKAEWSGGQVSIIPSLNIHIETIRP